MCPECFEILGTSDITQAVARERFGAHAGGSHLRAWKARNTAGTVSVKVNPIPEEVHVQFLGSSLDRSSPPLAEYKAPEARRILVPCQRPGCNAKVWNDCMELHIKNMHQPNRDAAIHVPSHRLPFDLLPPGTWDVRHVVEHYRRVAHKLPFGLNGRYIDNSRLERIGMLNPVDCYVGKESWLGYVVFEFSNSNRVVLECPIEGNATYILAGDWKAMVVLSKAELRHEFAHCYTKVVHKGAWLSRIRTALRGR